MLGAAREIIADEQANRSATFIRHLPGARVGVIERYIDSLEIQPKQAARGLESRLNHFVEQEVGLDLGLVQIEFRLTQLFGVVAPVPRREREVAALLRDHPLQGVAFGPVSY